MRAGRPRAEKTFILYNPPMVNRELGIRQSALTPARKIAGDLIDNKIQTIVFTTSRLNVEVLTKYLKDSFRAKIPGDDHYVTGYRGGYLPHLRRDIEKGLRERTVMGVVSTNALELGIDIGDLEACIMAGYPGSIASTWQQAGRAGRRAGHSLAILIAKSNPMDQFIVENPDYFFTRSPEHCRVNPDNLLILLHHIKSAAFELPFEEGERFGKEDLMELLGLPGGKGRSPPGGPALALGCRELSGRRGEPAHHQPRERGGGGHHRHRKPQGDRGGGLGQRLHHGARRGHLHGGIPAVPRGQARPGAQEGIRDARWMWITTPTP